MSTITGPTGPRVTTTQTPSTARQVSETSFLSRVQASTSGAAALSKPGNAPLVSGRDIVSTAVSAAQQKSGSAQGTGSTAETDPALDQRRALQEMSRAFLMGSIQSTFAGVAQAGSIRPDLED
ncbi:hypothetical protein D187_006003 [Cystobacter fuscus DSM 2262]|uniref:Uncharacterized protein n=1 Tax=Cystobacter fuscus (strain ATCC 25194 / DSM 2262 / NBRC 100088 / M29) TaxID=1242864 RepID=S9PGY8_CYSF2|nr:hypothetical protein [Cystobacter fuscus]EPX63595.1 hypothetical protein D187_006003 [Cystobacter fuscus DSM 2262]